MPAPMTPAQSPSVAGGPPVQPPLDGVRAREGRTGREPLEPVPQPDRVVRAALEVLASLGSDEHPWAQRLTAALQAVAQAAGVHAVRVQVPGSAESESSPSGVATYPLSTGVALELCVVGDTASAVVADAAIWEPVALLLGVLQHEERQRERLELEVGERVAELATHRRISEQIIDSLPLGLYVVDRDYRIQAWNHKRETGLQGVARQRAIGQTIFEVLHRQPAAVLKREFDEVFASGRMQQFQMESEATGTVRTFRLSKIPMRLDDAQPGFVTHVITIGEDITDWRAAVDRTAQSEKLAALGQMATGVMHEVNNPLATIAACAETLSLQVAAGDGDGVPSTDPRELLRIVDLEVQRAKRIVEGLLDFARPKPAQLTELDLNALVRQVLFLLQHHPRSKLISIVSELEETHALPLRGDADQLVQVVMALVLNALDASAPGSRVLLRSSRISLGRGRGLSATRSTSGECYCVLDVVDQGHGIPRESMAKVFEPFFTTKDPGRGTGLGLSICYGLIMEHGGLLSADSVLGRGATFRIVLPTTGAAPLAVGAPLPRLVHEPLTQDSQAVSSSAAASARLRTPPERSEP